MTFCFAVDSHFGMFNLLRREWQLQLPCTSSHYRSHNYDLVHNSWQEAYGFCSPVPFSFPGPDKPQNFVLLRSSRPHLDSYSFSIQNENELLLLTRTCLVVALLSHSTGSLSPAHVAYSHYQPAHSHFIRVKLLSLQTAKSPKTSLSLKCIYYQA